MQDGGEPQLYLQTPFTEARPQFSPDGRFLAYISNESGRFEVYARAFPATESKWRISTAGGTQPRWRADGRELYYLAADGKLMAVPLKVIDNALEVAAPTALFQTGSFGTAVNSHFTATPDGERFLLRAPGEAADTAPITVVLNWLSTLKE
jgi:Tol biopolymer transport system component